MLELERKFGFFIKKKKKEHQQWQNPVMEPRTTLWDKGYKDLGLYTWKSQLEKKMSGDVTKEQEHIN